MSAGNVAVIYVSNRKDKCTSVGLVPVSFQMFQIERTSVHLLVLYRSLSKCSNEKGSVTFFLFAICCLPSFMCSCVLLFAMYLSCVRLTFDNQSNLCRLIQDRRERGDAEDSSISSRLLRGSALGSDATNVSAAALLDALRWRQTVVSRYVYERLS